MANNYRIAMLLSVGLAATMAWGADESASLKKASLALMERMPVSNMAQVEGFRATEEHLAATVGKSAQREATMSEDVRTFPLIGYGQIGLQYTVSLIVFHNLKDQSAEVTAEFFDEDGRRAEVPVMDGSFGGEYAILRGRLGPRAASAMIAYSADGFKARWMRLRSTPAGSVGATVLLCTGDMFGDFKLYTSISPANRKETDATTVFLQPTTEADILWLSVVNDDTARQSFTLIARNENGFEGCRYTGSLPAQGQIFTEARNLLPCVSRMYGTLQVVSRTGLASALFFGTPDGEFVAVNALQGLGR